MKKSLVFLGSLLSIGALAGCNQTTPHEHTFKTEFAHDETNHWHEASCEHTDLISGLEAHNFGDDNICNDCGYTKPTPVVPHEHSFASAWSKDETNHWHAASCEHTELTSGLEAHNFGGDNVCDDCGYVKSTPEIAHEHTFASGWTNDETNHWHQATCEHIDLTSGLTAHNYGGDNVCDDCGYTKPTPEVPHEHTFKTDFEYDETNHWHEANCEHTDLISGLKAHDFGDDNTCNTCGYVRSTKYYSVIWKNYDGEILEIDYDVEEGTTPTCDVIPTKDDGGHVFNFKGWSPEVAPITQNMVYTAVIEQDMSQKLVIFKDDLGNELNRQTVLVGDEPDMTQFKYKRIINGNEIKVFTGWDKSLGKIYEDTTFVGSYETYKKTYAKDEIEAILTAEVFGNNVSFDYSYGTETAISWTNHIALSNGVYKEFSDPDENNSYSEAYADANYSYELYVQYGQVEMCRKRATLNSPESRIDDHFDAFVNDADYVYNENLDLYVSENSYKTVWLKFKDGKVCFLRYEFKQILGWFDTLEVTGVGDVPSISIPDYDWQTDIEPEHEHTFETKWTTDADNHWHAATCVHSDITSDFGPHSYGNDNVCDTCGYVKTVHIHSFSTEWSVDENKHWHAATCGHDDVTNFGSHIYGDDNICDICGYELIVKEQHIVYFASNGGSNVQPELVAHGEKVSKPDDPTKENYMFLGWYESPEYTGNTYDFEQEITENITLYALWGAKISYVNYDGETYHEENVRLNTKIGEPENPSWGEAHFLGWYESPDFDGTTFDFELGVSKNTTLYARYGYALELVGLNGETIASTLQPADEVVSNPGDTSIDYYDFDNYYSNSEYTQLFEFGEKLTKDTKIYLKFIPKTYNITYVAPDALENLNPTSYAYSIGISNLLEPTVAENKKFYGWYFDSDYTQPATSISTELHENVTLYAKIGRYYTITYNGWPKTIENPNPTKVTQYDYIELDKSPLEAIEGITDVKFMFAGEEETSKYINVSADITFDVVFSSPKTTITFDPNGGVFLPKNPFIYIDGPELAGGKKKIEITNNNGTFNLYNHAIMEELESTLGENGVFEGFYMDSEFKNPLSTTSIGANKIVNGSTIYAKFEEKPETNIPFETHNTWDELPGGDHYRLPVYDFAIPEGVTTISLNLKVLAANDATHILQVYDTTNKRNKIGDWSGRGKFEVNKSINVVGMSKIQLCYNYGGDQSSFYNYSLSIEPETRDRCFVQCVSSGEPITNECYYYRTPEIPYVSIEKEYFSFDGWLDSNNNKVDLTSDWVNTNEEVTLKANWVYSGHSIFANQIEKYAQRCSELLSRTDLDIDNEERLVALNRLNGTLLKVRGQFNLDPNRGYDQDLIEYNKSIEEFNKTMWDWFGELYNNQLLDKRIEILNEYSSKGDAFAETIRSTINNGLLELASLKNNPFEYHTSYVRTLALVEAILVSF